MAGGPVKPSSAFPVTSGNCFDGIYVKTGGTIDVHINGLGVAASIAADSTWRLVFEMPPTIPTGTPKIVLDCYADATSGIAKINPKWRAVSPDADLNGTALTAETVTPTSRTGGAATDSLQWEAGDNIRALRGKWNLDGTTAPTAGQIVLMDIVAETSGWTLATTLVVLPSIIWE